MHLTAPSYSAPPVVVIDRNRWSPSVGTGGRHRRNAHQGAGNDRFHWRKLGSFCQKRRLVASQPCPEGQIEGRPLKAVPRVQHEGGRSEATRAGYTRSPRPALRDSRCPATRAPVMLDAGSEEVILMNLPGFSQKKRGPAAKKMVTSPPRYTQPRLFLARIS